MASMFGLAASANLNMSRMGEPLTLDLSRCPKSQEEKDRIANAEIKRARKAQRKKSP